MATRRSTAKRSGSTTSDRAGEPSEQARRAEQAQQESGIPGTRRDAFEELARDRAEGRMVLLPRMLEGHDRRRHVRQTIREDHLTRIAAGEQEAREKFDKLADSMFSFFRGTALLFYRDMAGEDAWMPTVLTLGDVHPDNFGVMPSADNVPVFGVNDFDEAYYAPFTWDLKRGAVGFMIGAEVEGGHGRSKQRTVAEEFLRGYVEGISYFAERQAESEHQTRLDNAPKMIRKLIEKAEHNRDRWLTDDYHDEFRGGFRSSKKLVPQSSRRAEFQEIVDRWVTASEIAVPERAGEMRVKDVAVRRGQGTASLGLARYYVLIEGVRADSTDDIVIEFKQARRSAMAGLVPPSEMTDDSKGARIADAQKVQLVRGDVFYGSVEFDGLSFMSRERAPFRTSIDLDDLSWKHWRKYSRICGGSLAHAHAMSDESGAVEDDIEPLILESMKPRDLFVEDLLSFAEEAADRVRSDHEMYVEDHAAGAFRRIDRVYR